MWASPQTYDMDHSIISNTNQADVGAVIDFDSNLREMNAVEETRQLQNLLSTGESEMDNNTNLTTNTAYSSRTLKVAQSAKSLRSSNKMTNASHAAFDGRPFLNTIKEYNGTDEGTD